jgi:DNA repair protein RadC
MKIYNASLVFTLKEDKPEEKLNQPDLIASYMADAFELNPAQESFWVIFLNRKNYPMGRLMVTLGTATSSLFHPREVFRGAILAGATAIICAHNHPSGDPAPSQADLHATRILREASKVVDIELLDHVICGDITIDPMHKGYYSFREAGVL